jgi:hypothetical protein
MDDEMLLLYCNNNMHGCSSLDVKEGTNALVGGTGKENRNYKYSLSPVVVVVVLF